MAYVNIYKPFFFVLFEITQQNLFIFQICDYSTKYKISSPPSQSGVYPNDCFECGEDQAAEKIIVEVAHLASLKI